MTTTPPCLVLHGWPGTDHTHLRAGGGGGLGRLADRLRLLWCDHRGHGPAAETAGPSGVPLTMESLADDAATAAGAYGPSPVLVLGHYHGAGVAMELAIRHPERVAGLILLAATPGELGITEDLTDTFAVNVKPPEAEILQRVPPEGDDELAATMRGLERFFWADPDRSPTGSVFGDTTFSSAAAVSWTRSLNSWSIVDRLERITVPTLLLTGNEDAFAPPEECRRIAKRVAGAVEIIVERAGHLPWLDQPEAFDAAVDHWLPANGSVATA